MRVTVGQDLTSMLTKREVFAALALQGIVANPEYFKIPTNKREGSPAELAVRAADALIKELNKAKTGGGHG